MRGEHVSVIAVMGVEGVLCLKMVRSSVNGDIFLGLINPRHACAVRVTAHGLCVTLSLCMPVYICSPTTGYETAHEQY